MCWYPTPALAQDAGMTTPEFEDFLYGSCLLDWDAERERMQRHADAFDGAEQVRIVGAGTGLTVSMSGRRMEVDAGGANMPGGEFFGCPVETSAEGTIAFSEFPAVWGGRDVKGVRLRFSGGRIVDASAETVEAEAPRRLVQTMVAEWSDEVRREGPSRITYEIEPRGDMSRLTVTHDQLREGANDQLYGGWPMILSSLKSLLETGEPLDMKVLAGGA